MTKRRMQNWHWLALIGISLIIGMTAKSYLARAATETSPQQDNLILERRISTVEQRLYTIESNITRLEQQLYTTQRSTPSPISPQPQRDPEITTLRNELELLKGRVRELECGVVHLDERTLPASKRHSTTKDVCRQNLDAPVQLSMRP